MNMETSVSSTSPSKGAGSEPESDYDVEVVIFFVTTEHGLLMQDSFTKKFPLGNLLGIGVPRIFFQNAPNIQRTFENDALVDVNAKPRISSKLMRDFVGMDDIESNPNVKVALLDFSFFLTLGKLDEAYRCIKAIDSPSVWENMAQMCIKTKRLDVAEVCLGNMGHARGAAALRASRVENSVDVSVGILAIQLGFNDDAVKLFRETKRYDLLNKLYQAVGDWGKAIQVATNYDRVHLKTTHHNYAKHLESIGDIDLAIEHFELAETARHEVPRMLFNNGKIEELEHYVNRSKDEQLLKWWAQYMESNEYFDKACKYYRRGGDFLSLVRIACFKEDFNQASEIIQESGDRSAAYHFARQLEIQGDYHSAINFFADAGCYNHSIRLAKAYGLDAELMRFALESTPSLMIDCAIYFEERNEFEKAIQLYRKGGDLPRALDLCFRAGENNPSKSKAYYEMLNAIAQDLGADTSPQTLARCGEFLVNHKQFDKAVELFVMAKRYTQAIDMCMQHRVNITDEMVKMLTPNTDNMDPAEKKEIYQELGKALKKQGSYTLASKMYTQAGDRIRGIKCLVRSGDTKAVIKFAQVSRNAEIYTLAANYLQQMNWRESVDIMKAIIQFYTKANAFEQLAGFYDSCAQVEIDDYRDYEKAIGALKEALKYLNRAGTKSAADMSDMIEKRIGMIEKFVTAKKLMKRDPKAMVAMCEELLQEPMLEEAIRSGDCLAMLVEYFHDSGNFAEAHHYIEEMEARRIPLHPYVDAEVIEAVVKATGGPKGQSKKSKNSGGSKPTGGPSSGVARVGLADSKTDDDVIDEVDEPKQDIKANVGLGDTFGTTDSQQSQGMLARDEDELDEDLDELEEDFEPEPSPVKNKRAPLMTNVTLGQHCFISSAYFIRETLMNPCC
jgi:intraflagellar transport protein 140